MFSLNKTFFRGSAALFLAAASLYLGSPAPLYAGAPDTAKPLTAEELEEQFRQQGGTPSKETTASPVTDDVSSASLASTFMNFEVAREGDDPTRVTLYGMIFDDCLDAGKVVISNSKTDSAMLGRNPGIAGFRIIDRDHGAQNCMARHIAQHDICGRQFSCTSIDQLPGAVLVLHEKGDFKIRLGRFDPNQSRSEKKVQWEDFPEPQDDYKGENSRVSEEGFRRSELAASKREKREKFEKALMNQAKTCRKDHASRLVALEAAEILEDRSLMTAEEVEKIKKEINRAELRALAVKLSKAKTPEDIDEATAALSEFAADNEESADSVAGLLHQKAGLVAKTGRKIEDYDHANTLVEEAQTISGISESTSKYLDNDLLGIRVGRYQAMAQSPNVDPYDFWNGYSSMMSDLRYQVSDCYSGGYSQSCSGTMQAFNSGMKIPQMAQQAAYERQMFEMQMQQQMSSAFGQWGGGGFGGGASPFFQ